MVVLPSCGVEAASSAGEYYGILISMIYQVDNSLFSRFLGNIKAAYDKNPNLVNLLLDDFFKDAIDKCQVRIT